MLSLPGVIHIVAYNICISRLFFNENVFIHRVHWYGISPLWVLICVSRLLVLENALSHWVHWYGFSLVWVIICRSKLLFRGNAHYTGWTDMICAQYELSYVYHDYSSLKMFFSHRVHWYGFFPVWVIICWFRLLIHKNAFSHRVHWYGFSPVWVIICASRVLLCENAFSHWIYLFGFSPEWAFICWPRSPLANSIGDIEKLLEILE